MNFCLLLWQLLDFSSRREQTADKPAGNTAADDDDDEHDGDDDDDEHHGDDDDDEHHGDDEHDSELIQGWLGFSGARRSTIEMLTNTLCQRSTIGSSGEGERGVGWKGLLSSHSLRKVEGSDGLNAHLLKLAESCRNLQKVDESSTNCQLLINSHLDGYLPRVHALFLVDILVNVSFTSSPPPANTISKYF